MRFFLVFSISLTISLQAVAQNADDYEPVTAAGDNHIVLLENEKMRVLQVVILPGETVPYHQHTMESVFVTLQPARLEFRDLEGNVIRISDPSHFKELPHVEWRKAAPAPRAVTNVDSITMRALRLEYKDEE